MPEPALASITRGDLFQALVMPTGGSNLESGVPNLVWPRGRHRHRGQTCHPRRSRLFGGASAGGPQHLVDGALLDIPQILHVVVAEAAFDA